MTRLARTKYRHISIVGDNDENNESLIDLSYVTIQGKQNNNKRLMQPIDGIEDDNDDNSLIESSESKAMIGLIDDTADNDINLHTQSRYALPPDPEGDLEDRLGLEMPSKYGVQNYQETTYYPENRRTVTRRISFQE